MPKKTDRSPEEKARKKLAQAQLKLRVAEDHHIQARAKGKQEVERARLRAAKWLTKSAEEVERRREQLDRAEVRLQSVLNGETDGDSNADTASGEQNGTHVVAGDWEAVNEALGLDGMVPDTQVPTDDDYTPELPSEGMVELRERELRALRALAQEFDGGIASVSDWRSAAVMPETTFARARRALLVNGLVEVQGNGTRGSRYLLTDLGRSLAAL